MTVLYQGLQFINRLYRLSGTEMNNFFQELRERINDKSRTVFDDINAFSDDEFSVISPITKLQFEEIFTFCVPISVNDTFRYISKKDLLLFLTKMRHNLSDEFLKVIFKYSNRQAVSLAISLVRKSLMLQFVPNNIGLYSITREDYIRNYVTPFSNVLYNPNLNESKAILIVDASYSYMEKSSNFKTLRQSFSVHKGHHVNLYL